MFLTINSDQDTPYQKTGQQYTHNNAGAAPTFHLGGGGQEWFRLISGWATL